jgi:hypothetical protein
MAVPDLHEVTPVTRSSGQADVPAKTHTPASLLPN